MTTTVTFNELQNKEHIKVNGGTYYHVSSIELEEDVLKINYKEYMYLDHDEFGFHGCVKLEDAIAWAYPEDKDYPDIAIAITKEEYQKKKELFNRIHSLIKK